MSQEIKIEEILNQAAEKILKSHFYSGGIVTGKQIGRAHV